MRYAREERYALMEEEVSILKALWTTRGPLNFQVRDATERQKQEMKTLYNKSAANRHVHELAREHGDLLLPQLWTGITRVRPGAGIALVGNPAQCADTLPQFIDAGCHSTDVGNSRSWRKGSLGTHFPVRQRSHVRIASGAPAPGMPMSHVVR